MESSSNDDNDNDNPAATHGPQDEAFVEIRLPKQDTRPRTVEAHVLHIEPQQCSQLVKQLAHDFPLGRQGLDLTHLKRVQKPKLSGGDYRYVNSKKNKKQKMLQLQVLVGAVNGIEQEKYQELTEKFGPMEVVTVPGRPPESQEEWKEWNAIWPTTLLPLKWEEHAQQQLALKPAEIKHMKHAMSQLQKGTTSCTPTFAALVMDPVSGTIVATSWKEQQEQQKQGVIVVFDNNNPLATPILLALQGVSRLERAAALAKTKDEFSKGQYLCTGYDLYVSYEPSVFESMACVHARLRRLVFANSTNSDGQVQVPRSNVFHKGCSSYNLHCLPGTNHHYRAFRYDPPQSPGTKDKTKEDGQDITR
jgi:tRNA-specific adenosine deaminase 3